MSYRKSVEHRTSFIALTLETFGNKGNKATYKADSRPLLGVLSRRPRNEGTHCRYATGRYVPQLLPQPLYNNQALPSVVTAC